MVTRRHGCRVEPGDLLGDEDALGEAAVGELEPGDDVADRPQPLDARAAPLVGDDEAALEGDPGLLVPEALGDRPRPTATRRRSAASSSPPSSRTVTPVSSCCADSNRTPVRTVMPRLRKARSRAAELAGSSAATSRGRASTTVTSEPNERMTEANSTPMTPPPRTTTRPGTSLEPEGPVARHDPPAELEAGQRAGGGPGGEDDVPPDEAAVADDARCDGPSSRPAPSTYSTSRARTRPWRPLCSRATTPSR